MRGATVIILHAFVAQATIQDPVDNIADMLVDKLTNRIQNTGLDMTTLGKTHPDLGTPAIRGAQPLVPSPVSMAQNKLRAHGISPSPMETLALTAVDAANRGTGMRNVAAMAMKLPSDTQAALSKLSKEVVVKAESIKDMAGVTAPLGFWDPWALSTKCSEQELLFYREAELKHGRVGMLATLGIISGEMFSPLFGYSGPPIPAVQWVGKATPAAPEFFWMAVFVAAGFAEAAFQNGKTWATEPTGPGDFQWDPLGMRPKDEKGLKELQNKELNNGRLAMLAAAGIIAQELVTGQKTFR